MPMTCIIAAYRPRRLSPGHPREGAAGYPADDQPTAAVFRCGKCGWVGDGDECEDGRKCPKCGEGETS